MADKTDPIKPVKLTGCCKSCGIRWLNEVNELICEACEAIKS